MDREFICMEETVTNTQKKIRQWLNSGYKIEIIAQNVVVDPHSKELDGLVTSLWKWKEIDLFEDDYNDFEYTNPNE